jgi:hypothetical protein
MYWVERERERERERELWLLKDYILVPFGTCGEKQLPFGTCLTCGGEHLPTNISYTERARSDELPLYLFETGMML